MLSCFDNSVWCALVTDATEQLFLGPQGIVFVFENCCYVKWHSLNICPKILVVKISDLGDFWWVSFAV